MVLCLHQGPVAHGVVLLQEHLDVQLEAKESRPLQSARIQMPQSTIQVRGLGHGIIRCLNNTVITWTPIR